MTNEKKKYSNRIKRSFILLTILFCLVLLGFGWILSDVRKLSNDTSTLTKKTNRLTLANRSRINDIQESRLASCKLTYSGVREVLRPFFPKKNHRTKREEMEIKKLNRTIYLLQHGCISQTQPSGGG